MTDENVTNQRRRDMVLATFSEISSIPRIDVRTRQMECVLEVLETCGEKLNSAWPVLLNIIQGWVRQFLEIFFWEKWTGFPKLGHPRNLCVKFQSCQFSLRIKICCKIILAVSFCLHFLEILVDQKL